MALSDPSGAITDTYNYGPWGDVTAGSGNTTTDNPYKYAGKYGYYTHYQEPDFGLLQLGVRFYDANTGRFTQLDPIGDGINWYAYAINSPTGWIDPDGETPVALIAGAIGAGVGGVIGGVVAVIQGDNVLVGIGRGALVGGVSGVVAGIAGPAAAAAAGGSIWAGIAGGVAGGVAGDIAAQGLQLALGWQCDYNVVETIGAAALGGVLGGGSALLKGLRSNGSGLTVYRVYGGDATAAGRSYTFLNPKYIPSYRKFAGLPDANSGQFVIRGVLRDFSGVKIRMALPLDGNPGGLPELVIPNALERVDVKFVGGANPAF